MNNSDYPVIVKPEEPGKPMVIVQPHTPYDGAIDGVKPPAYGGDWYKVQDGTDVTINKSGEPEATGEYLPDSPDLGPAGLGFLTDRLPGRKKEPDFSDRWPDWKCK